MKRLQLLAVLFLVLYISAAAQNRKLFRINPGHSIQEVIAVEEAYSYPEFKDGVVTFKDGSFSTAKMNLSYLIGEMRFIDAKGDTLSLADENRIRSILIGPDTFYFDKVYVKAIGDFGKVKLAERQFFTFVNRQKVGGFGELSSASIDTYDVLSVANAPLQAIVAKEILTIARYKVYYIGDRFNHFRPISRPNLLDLYPDKEKEIKDYLKHNKVNYFDEGDVKGLLLHLKGS